MEEETDEIHGPGNSAEIDSTSLISPWTNFMDRGKQKYNVKIYWYVLGSNFDCCYVFQSSFRANLGTHKNKLISVAIFTDADNLSYTKISETCFSEGTLGDTACVIT
ncbi:15588_t:CDS:2 [Rhizophagus irregularis]|nr:15588_t:CDS:2 [Rhizophagus irregularis]